MDRRTRAIGGLRQLSAEPVTAQERLDKIVTLIAENMAAEVCSVYMLRVDAALELYATEGLNRDAVHYTVMLPDEELVGFRITRDGQHCRCHAEQPTEARVSVQVPRFASSASVLLPDVSFGTARLGA